MKKSFLFILTALTLQTTVFAQKNNFKIAPNELAAQRFTVSYERAFGDKNSVGIDYQTRFVETDGPDFGWFLFLKIIGGEYEYTETGSRVDLTYRRYFGGSRPLNGFYAETGFGWGSYEIKAVHEPSLLNIFDFGKTETIYEGNIKTASFVLKSGYQWAWKNGVSVDLGLGVRNNTVNKKDIRGEEPDLQQFSGWLPQLNAKVGFAF